jgi:flagellar hook assembly protein FlgD
MTPRLGLLNAYPNPFNSKAIITYKDLKGGEIEIYNINGQKVRAFKTAEIKEGQIEWDARDALGNKVSSGIYFARARGGRDNITIKLVYLR